MSEKKSRRQFLKAGFITASALATSLITVKYDVNEGVQTGCPVVRIGAAEAQATCGMGLQCSGGGGECGMGLQCGGGGGRGGSGQCGMGLQCSGGGGQCGMGLQCGGQ